MSPAIPTDTRPLIDRLREAVPGLRWVKEGRDVVGYHLSIPAKAPVAIRMGILMCWLDSKSELHAVNTPSPSDDEVVRIVKDWYTKTHPAKSVTERTKELIREAVPGVEIREDRALSGTYITCSVSDTSWTVFNDSRTTLERIEEVKDAMVASAREALVKPTNTIPLWASKIRDRFNASTPSEWLCECVGGEWRVVSAKHGQTLVVTCEAPYYSLEVHEGGAVLPYRKQTGDGLETLAKQLCKARNDLGYPEDVQLFAKEMRDAGFSASLGMAPVGGGYVVTVKSSTGEVEIIRAATVERYYLGRDASKYYTRSAISPLVRLELTKQKNTEEHEAFEKKAREATTQYLKDAGMAAAKVTPTMTANAMVDLLASQGVEATIETIDDHIAVCVTDPSTGEVHKAICDPAGNWLMDGEDVYGLVAATELRELGQRQKRKRAKKMDMEKVKEMAVNAAYLTAANKVTESMQTLVVAGLMRQLGTDDESTRMKLAAFFSTDIGAAFVAGGTGFALQVLPHEEDGRIERLAESLQTSGMAKAMGAAVDVILQPMLGSVQEALKGLPEPPKVRATPDAQAEEHEEPAHTGRRARSAR